MRVQSKTFSCTVVKSRPSTHLDGHDTSLIFTLFQKSSVPGMVERSTASCQVWTLNYAKILRNGRCVVCCSRLCRHLLLTFCRSLHFASCNVIPIAWYIVYFLRHLRWDLLSQYFIRISLVKIICVKKEGQYSFPWSCLSLRSYVFNCW